MRLNPVDILANWYTDETLPWSAQKAVNCLAETAEVGGTRSVSMVKGLPGMTALANLGTGLPIRGAEDVEGTLFVVSGTSLFQINPDNSFINRGNIPGVTLVSMAHNKQGGTLAANELVIANGLSGYVYNTDTTILSQITDDAFPGATTFDYVDGYISFTDPEGRFWGHSALNQATQYSSIDRYDAESAPDKIISHIVSHREVMVFGTRTTEFFRNTGAATGTFQRVDGTEMEVGIAATLARARLDNTVYWLGNDGIVYRLAGHSPQRVSNRPIEQAISRFNLANAFAHTWEDRGHKVFYLTFPDGLTFGFDVATSLWHARETYGIERWGVNTTTKWNGQWVAGDFSNGKLYRLNWDDYTEDGRPLVMECQPGVTHADGNEVLCPYVEIFMDTGQSPNPADIDPLQITGDAPDALVDVPYSYTYSAMGGFGIYTFSISAGTPPPGVTLSPSGILSGNPDTTGNYTFTVTVTDSLGNTASVPDSVAIQFSANLFSYTQSGNIVTYRSGVSSSYPVLQSLAGTNPPQDWSSNQDGEYVMYVALIAPFVAIFRRQPNGTYNSLVSPLTPAPTLGQACAISRDSTYVAIATNSGWRVHKRDAGGNAWSTVVHTSAATVIFSIKFSPDGNYLIVGYANGMTVYSRSGDTFTQIFNDGTFANTCTGIAWYKDSSRFAVTIANAPVRVYSVSGVTITQIGVSALNAPGQSTPVWSNDGAYLHVRGNAAPFLRSFAWTGIALTAIANPATMPTLSTKLMSISNSGNAIYMGEGLTGGYVYSPGVGGVLSLISTITPAQISGQYVKSGDYAI